MKKKTTKKKPVKKTTKKKPKLASTKPAVISPRPGTKKKPKPKPKAKPKPKLDMRRLGKIVELIVIDGLTEEEIAEKDKAADLGDYLEAARARLSKAAELDAVAEYGAAISRFKYIFSLSKAAGDLASMNTAGKEINKLLSVYPAIKAEEAADGVSSTREGQELEAIAAHLLPLGLASAQYPISGHARIAADRIHELEARE